MSTLKALAGAQAVLAASSQAAVRPCVLIEVDVDAHRGGVPVDSAQLIEIGRCLHEGGAELVGVMSHAGSSYDCTTPDDLQRMAEQERARTVMAAQDLRAVSLPCPVVSIGSTPAALSALRLEGVTEVRAGVYVFFDLVMAGTGACSLDEIALSVLTTVIGHQPERGWIIVDAGWMALSRDRGTQKQLIDRGYGVVCDAAGTVLPNWIVCGANQEHGIVSSPVSKGPVGDLERLFSLGIQLRILPNHACATGAQHGGYHLLSGGEASLRWSRFGGW